MDICPVKLMPQVIDSLILIKTDLPVPSNFTQVINYYGDKDWIGLWVDVPKRLTVFDGQSIRTTLQLGWHSYLKHPEINARIQWLKRRGYHLLPSTSANITSNYGLLYQRSSRSFYLCDFSTIYLFLKYQVPVETSPLNVTDPKQELQWIEEFKNLARKESSRLQDYKIYYVKAVKKMQKWLDAYFLSLYQGNLESMA